MLKSKHLLGNSPINNFDEDLFNFKHYADKVKKIIQLNSSNSEPLVIGIYGKWGEGKTSFMNLLKHKIEYFEKDENGKEYLIYDFNPWRYSNEDEMMFDFFDGLSKRFYVKKNTQIQEVGIWILKYSKYLKAIKISATAGIPKVLNGKVEFSPDKIFESLGGDLKGEQITLDFFKDNVNIAIKNTNFKIVVFIDDLDRLDKNEIYTILKLIKLNASFDNFIFITTLDSEHVAKAIKDRYGDNDEDGKLFLEKIINIPISLPKIEVEDLQFFFEIKIKKIFNSIELKNQELKEHYLKEIVQDFSADYFKSPREIIRVLNSFFIGAYSLANEVNLRDLFWIEWLKIKNERLYKKIRNYNPNEIENIISGQSKIINFNDDMDLSLERKVTNGDKVNGTRKKLIDEFEDYKWIIDKLFPSIIINESLINSFDVSLNINSAQHFDKFFSYHTERKVEVLKINLIKDHIKNNKDESLKVELDKLFNSNIGSYKALYGLEGIIKNIGLNDNRNYFFNFLFKNIDLIPLAEIDLFGQDYRTRIIKLVGSILNNDTENDNNRLIIELSSSLILNYLLHFIISFDNDKPYIQEIEKLFLTMSKEKLNGNSAFYIDFENILNRWFLEFWNKYEPDEFREYIENSMVDIDNIKYLIRSFSIMFNGINFGALSKEKFNFMKKSINVDFVYNKINALDEGLVESVDINNFVFDNYDESTLNHNIKQFIFWYKKEKLTTEN